MSVIYINVSITNRSNYIEFDTAFPIVCSDVNSFMIKIVSYIR